jgi:hypothetical protein
MAFSACQTRSTRGQRSVLTRRLRAAAAIITIIGGLPGVLATALMIRAYWIPPPSETHSIRERTPETDEAERRNWEDGTSVCRPSSMLR